MICYMFPGQPLTNMADLPNDSDFVEICELARSQAGLDLQRSVWITEPSTGQVALQVYGTAMSLYRNRILRKEGRYPAVVAEHSMGIYSALASVGSVSEADALELTFRIGRALARMGESGSYSLGCITGLPVMPLLALAENNGVHLANYNTSRHFLLAGEQQRIESAITEALEAGAFSVSRFPSDAPLHTPLIAAVTGELKEVISDYHFAEPTVPLMEHIGQEFLAAADIPGFLAEELCMPVHWEATYLALRKAGVTVFAEAGAGEALSKYNRWIATEQG